MQKAISLITISIIFLLILSVYTYKESIDKFSILSEDKLDTIITVNKAENRCTNLLETFKTGIYKIYITDENPRYDDPKKIRDQIFSCCKNAIVIANRMSELEEFTNTAISDNDVDPANPKSKAKP